MFLDLLLLYAESIKLVISQKKLQAFSLYDFILHLVVISLYVLISM